MMTEDGWEQPIGLTAEYAIDLLDSDDDDDDGESSSPTSCVLEATKSADAANADNEIQLKRKRDDECDDRALQLQENKQSDSAANPFAEYVFDASSSTSAASSRRSAKRPEIGIKQQPRKQQHDDAQVAVDMKQLIAKWHAFADPNAPVEQQRFQLLVAARLHARCQEKVVLKTMDRLRSYFNESFPHGLTVHTLAGSDPESDIAPLLSSILFGNVKAVQIVQAAKDVISKFGGNVPESECSLKDITGIGPKLAEVLAVVNRRSTYST